MSPDVLFTKKGFKNVKLISKGFKEFIIEIVNWNIQMKRAFHSVISGLLRVVLYFELPDAYFPWKELSTSLPSSQFFVLSSLLFIKLHNVTKLCTFLVTP